MKKHFLPSSMPLSSLFFAATIFTATLISGTAQNGPATEGEGLIRNEPDAFQGYTLVSPLQSDNVYLFDMEGRVVNMWETEFRPASMAYLLENGNLLRPGEQPNPPWGRGPAAGGRLQEYSWDGELVWDFTYLSETALPHHDIEPMPNGNVLMLVKDKVTAEEAIAMGRPAWSVEGTDIQMEKIIEVKPTGKTTGEIVWTWHLKDHLIQDYDPEKANYGDVSAHPELVDINYDRGRLLSAPDAQQRRSNADWTHANAIDYNAELDQIVISVHSFSEIWIIDHSTTTEEAATHSGGRSGKGGDLLYRWGNPRTYRQGTTEDQTLFSQHDSNWIPEGYPGAGHLMVFNNGNERPGGDHSTADEIVPLMDENGNYLLGDDGKYGPESVGWSYAAPNPRDFYSNFISGARRLPNGNTIIASGANGILFEVTPDKDVVWQYMNPDPNASAGRGRGGRGGRGGGPNRRSVFRAYRYGPEYPGLVGKTLTPDKDLVEMVREQAVQQRQDN